ncbi:MAG: SdrD B-like domain-containing protein, partial [Acidimicrobiia bacterium]
MSSVALSRGRIGHVRRFLIVGLAAVLLMAVTATIPGAPLGAHRAEAAPPASDPGVVANPQIGAACGIDVVFTFDGSNSIDSTEGGEMISAAQSFVDVLEGSPSHVAATYFRGISAAGGNGVGGLVPNAGWTDISSSANATAFNTALGSFSPWSGPNDQGGTNWEDGFNTADPLLPRPDTKPDLILFMTDGNPTTYNGSDDLGSSPGTDDLWSGMREANQHKSEGTRVVGIGIGDGLSETNIAKISGPEKGSDYFLAADFDDLEDILVDIALSACTSSVTVHKYLDGTLSNGWDFNASPQQLAGTTGDNGLGTVTFAFNSQPNTPVSTTITETLEDGHLFDDASCTLDGQPIGSPESLGVSLTIGFLDHVQCVFNNSAPDPDIELVKVGTLVDGGDGVDVGDTITYAFTVTNTGNVTLTNVTVADTVGGVTITGTAIPSLAPNASNSTAYTGTYTLTQADIDAGTFTNTAEACGLDSAEAEVCDEDEYEQPLTQTTGLVIEKLTNGEDADTATGPLVRAGDLVTWSYEVSNTGNVSLFEVTVSDSVSGVNPGYFSGDDGNGVLDPGEMWIYEATGFATAGQYVNVGTVEALDPTDESLTAADPSHYFGVEASIDLVKTGAFGLGDDGTANPGDVISYEFEVTNTGNVDLTSIDVEDLDLGGIAVACPDTGLAVGEAMTCTAAYPVSQEDINNGSVDNCAIASGVDPIADAVSDEDCFETVVGQLPSISVIKVAEPEIIPIGSESVVTWTIDVTNTGNVPLVDVSIADPLVPSCEANIGDLGIGATTTHTCTSTHMPDSLSWTFTNIAVATGIGPDGTEVTDDDEATLLPIQVLGTAQLGDTVWNDTNKNGVQDSGEAGINGAKVTLKDADGAVIATATTAKGPWDGWYKFVG